MTTDGAWEIINGNKEQTSRVCVKYNLKSAKIIFQRSNIYERLEALLKAMFSEEGLREDPDQATPSDRHVRLPFVTQLSSTRTRVRFVLEKREHTGGDSLNISLYQREKGQWSSVTIGELFVDTAAIALKLGHKRVAFAGSDGFPTKKPVFELTENSGLIFISTEITPLSEENFERHFKVARRSKKKQEKPSESGEKRHGTIFKENFEKAKLEKM